MEAQQTAAQRLRGSKVVRTRRNMTSLRSNCPFGGALNKFISKPPPPNILFLFSCSNYLRIGFMLMCEAFVPRGGFICLQRGKRKKTTSLTMKWRWWSRSELLWERRSHPRRRLVHGGDFSTMGKKHRRWICGLLPPRLFSQCLSEIWISLKITWGPLNANFGECAKPLL